MLAERRHARPHGVVVDAAQVQWVAGDPEGRALDVEHHAALVGLRRLDGLGDRAQPTGGDAGPLQLVHDLVTRQTDEHRLDLAVQLVAVRDPGRRVDEAGAGGEPGFAEPVGEQRDAASSGAQIATDPSAAS